MSRDGFERRHAGPSYVYTALVKEKCRVPLVNYVELMQAGSAPFWRSS
jgi:hypothetical protein